MVYRSECLTVDKENWINDECSKDQSTKVSGGPRSHLRGGKFSKT